MFAVMEPRLTRTGAVIRPCVCAAVGGSLAYCHVTGATVACVAGGLAHGVDVAAT